MIKSMTGYGRARQMLHQRDITVEVRAVNNRYLDCTVKMPRAFLFAEDAMKRRVQEAVSRGKVDVFVTVDATAADTVQVAVNAPLAESYLRALRLLMDQSRNFLLPDTLLPVGDSELWKGASPFAVARTLAGYPDVLSVTKAETDLEGVEADLCAVLDEALENFNAMRAQEGKKLAEDLANRLDAVERYTAQVEARSPETVAEYREKLLRRMREALRGVTVDEQRILAEAAIYADKTAVDEETVRLRSHVSQLRGLLTSNAPQGRRMDFLIQEINREANTIGSKCADVSIARVVVELKAEVEKMREQAQNVE